MVLVVVVVVVLGVVLNWLTLRVVADAPQQQHSNKEDKRKDVASKPHFPGNDV